MVLEICQLHRGRAGKDQIKPFALQEAIKFIVSYKQVVVHN